MCTVRIKLRAQLQLKRLGEPVSGMKAGVLRQQHCFEDLHPDVESGVAEAIKSPMHELGVEVVETRSAIHPRGAPSHIDRLDGGGEPFSSKASCRASRGLRS